jgi:uncharacterized membrane protein
VFEQNGINFPFLLRFPSIIADVVTLAAVCHMAMLAERRVPVWTLILFALSPVSLMVSGFHGNTDPVMVMFLALGALMCMRHKPMLCGLFFALSCQVKIVPALLLPIFFFFWLHRRAAWEFLGITALTSVALWSVPLFNFPVAFAKNVLSYGSFWGLWGITYWLRLTGWPEFGRVTYVHFTPAQNVVGCTLKLIIIAAVFLIAWRRRSLNGMGLVRSLGLGWVIFFALSPGVCAQYLVWLAPFILFLSNSFFAWLTATSSLFLFFFYNSIADKFPWYIGISHGGHNPEWTPWSAWPWGTLIAGALILWRKAKHRDPSLRLLSLKPIAPELAN